MPRGVHSGRRGPKPLPWRERIRRHKVSTRRASAKYNAKHRHEIRDHKSEQNFRFRQLNFTDKLSREAFQVIQIISTRKGLFQPEFVFQPPHEGRWKRERVLSSAALERWAEDWKSRLKLSARLEAARA